VDEYTGASVEEFLRQLGHDVLAVAEHMPQTDDTTILTKASDEARILLTNDKDFGELIFLSGQAHAGVLLLRLRDETPANRIRVIQAVLDQVGDELADHFVVATDTHIRVRPAP
jgi:predicted nuclease of predicted toxin-antitoxin system